jgi:hypothetical protein
MTVIRYEPGDATSYRVTLITSALFAQAWDLSVSMSDSSSALLVWDGKAMVFDAENLPSAAYIAEKLGGRHSEHEARCARALLRYVIEGVDGDAQGRSFVEGVVIIGTRGDLMVATKTGHRYAVENVGGLRLALSPGHTVRAMLWDRDWPTCVVAEVTNAPECGALPAPLPESAEETSARFREKDRRYAATMRAGGVFPDASCKACDSRSGRCCQHHWHHIGDCCLHCGMDERTPTYAEAEKRGALGSDGQIFGDEDR